MHRFLIVATIVVLAACTGADDVPNMDAASGAGGSDAGDGAAGVAAHDGATDSSTNDAGQHLDAAVDSAAADASLDAAELDAATHDSDVHDSDLNDAELHDADVIDSDVTDATDAAADDAGDPRAPESVTCVKASNTGAEDLFGYSIAIDGDTLVVGAYQESSNAQGINGDQTSNSMPFSGAVYVFVRSNNQWTQQAYIKASNTDADDYFGFSVALEGDLLIVGAPLEDSAATHDNGDQLDNTALNSGAAYAFVRSGNTWSQQAYIKPSDTTASWRFGGKVALSGNTIVVGSDNASNRGAAYVFVLNNGAWSEQAKLGASHPDMDDGFGFRVAIDGDTALIGAPNEDSNATGVNGNAANDSMQGSGAAYVFVRNGGTWTQQAYLKANFAAEDTSFGYGAAIQGDTIVIGAHREDSDATGIDGDDTNNDAIDSGAAFVFERSGGLWSQRAYIKASNAEANDRFGWTVDIDNDRIVVGAELEDSNAVGIDGDEDNNGAIDSGAAYVFGRHENTWLQLNYLKANNTGARDSFGRSVAISGNTIVAGAYFEDSFASGVGEIPTDNNASNSGAVYIFQ